MTNDIKNISEDLLKVSLYLINAISKTEHKITSKRLAKLTYFANGWSYALYDKNLFSEDFIAYPKGPVVKQQLDNFDQLLIFDIKNINFDDVNTSILDDIVKAYNGNDDELIQISHEHMPWRVTPNYQTISRKVINNYFSNLNNCLDHSYV